jgi:hypothetical protein
MIRTLRYLLLALAVLLFAGPAWAQCLCPPGCFCPKAQRQLSLNVSPYGVNLQTYRRPQWEPPPQWQPQFQQQSYEVDTFYYGGRPRYYPAVREERERFRPFPSSDYGYAPIAAGPVGSPYVMPGSSRWQDPYAVPYRSVNPNCPTGNCPLTR